MMILACSTTRPQRSAGRHARRLNDLVYTVLLANGGSFFAAGNANYLDGAGTNFQASSLAAANQMMRGQVDADGAVLDIVPKVLLVPPELEPTAKALLQSDYIQLTSTSAAGAHRQHLEKRVVLGSRAAVVDRLVHGLRRGGVVLVREPGRRPDDRFFSERCRVAHNRILWTGQRPEHAGRIVAGVPRLRSGAADPEGRGQEQRRSVIGGPSFRGGGFESRARILAREQLLRPRAVRFKYQFRGEFYRIASPLTPSREIGSIGKPEPAVQVISPPRRRFRATGGG